MKTRNMLIVSLLAAALFATSCEKDSFDIQGQGPVVTQTLELDEFTGIDFLGTDKVFISYGTEQSVVVEGHANIIERIKTKVKNNIWDIELEEGGYKNYELTYYLTLPLLENVYNTGTGNVVITEFPAQESLNIRIMGTGSFLGYPMELNTCEVDVTGTGSVEVSVNDQLDVSIDGTGHVYYKGNPIVNADIVGTGSVSRFKN